MSTAQQPAPRRNGATVATAALRRAVASYLLQFLAFAAALSLVIVLLARAPESCDCEGRTAQVVLLALAGLLAAVGTVLLATATGRVGSGRRGAVLIGVAVLLIVMAGLVALW